MDLELADGVVVLAENLTTFQAALKRAKRYALEIGLEINPTKTKMSYQTIVQLMLYSQTARQ